MPRSLPPKSSSGAHLVPTNLPGVLAFTPPKPGSVHTRADKKTLKRHGIPLRPRGKGSERAARIWDSLLARELRHIHPHLEVLPVRKQPPGTRGKTKRSGGTTNAADSSAIWSGGVLQSPRRMLVSAYGEWLVPTVRRPDGAPGYDSPWRSSTWIGLDGYKISDDVLQAGTAQYINIDDGDDVAHYYAWYEWYLTLKSALITFPWRQATAFSSMLRSMDQMQTR